MRLKGKVNWRSLVITLSAIVVFVTTYLLILPAITLDKKAAIEQGGIDVAIEQTIDETTDQTAGTVDADAADADEQAAADEAAAADTAKATEDPAPEPAKKENAAKTEEKAPDSGEVELLTKTKELTADKEKSADFTVSAVVNEADKVPADVTLQATELTKDTEGFDYDKYYEEALKALKKDDSDFKGISMIRFYDISLESDTQDESVEPSDKVSVKIEYDKGIEVSDADNIRIVHFGEKKTEVLDTKENKVEANVDDDNKLTEATFETDGFSVYAIVEQEEGIPQPPRVTYEFEDPNNPDFTFIDKAGNPQTTQIIKNGEVLQDVGLPNIPEGDTFSGWFIYDEDTGTWGEQISFESPISVAYGDTSSVAANSVTIISDELDEDGTYHVKVKAFYGEVVYFTFYEDVAGTNILTLIQIPKGSNYDISTQTVNSPGSELAFGGWAETAGAIDDERPAITPTVLTNVQENDEFYPIFRAGHWISFYAGATGSGATYTAPAFVIAGGNASSAQPANPEWKGYAFQYWTEENLYTGENGSYVQPSSAPARFNFNNTLSGDKTLYAYWTPADTTYTVVFWKQNVTDNKNATDAQKTYSFSEQITEHGTSGSTVEAANYSNLPNTDDDYKGFVLNSNKSDTSITVNADGTSIINIYFDRQLITMRFYKNGNQTTEPDGGYNWNGWTTSSNVTTYTGLYGQTLAQNGYTWPDHKWQYYASNDRTMGMTFLGQFVLPDVRDTTGKEIRLYYIGDQDESTLEFYLQNTDGSTYPLSPSDTGTGTSTATFFFSEKYDGFEVKQYRRYYLDNNGNKVYVDANGNVQNNPENAWSPAAVDASTPLSLTVYTGNNNDHMWTYGTGNDVIVYSGTRYTGNANNYDRSQRNDYIYTYNGNGSFSRLYAGSDFLGRAYYYYLRNPSATTGTNGTQYGRIEFSNGSAGYIQLTRRDGYRAANCTLEVRYARKHYTLKYLDSVDSTELSGINSQDVVYGESLVDYQPDSSFVPVSQYPGKEWDGKWYKDQACTEEFVWTDTMPNADMVVYAGWEDVQYKVDVDPNGGVLTESEATFTWLTYGRTIQEYQDVTRNYVEDPNGTLKYESFLRSVYENQGYNPWYYQGYLRTAKYVSSGTNTSVDMVPYGGGQSEGTVDYPYESTRYKYEKDAYALLGWYELTFAEGHYGDLGYVIEETPYSFGTGITHDTYIQAKWRRIGEFHVEYKEDVYLMDEEGNIDTNDSGIDTTNIPSDGNSYADQSQSAIMHATDSPITRTVGEGDDAVNKTYVFQGWYYDGKLYTPGDVFTVKSSLAQEKVIGQDPTTGEDIIQKTVYIYPVYQAVDDLPVDVTHIYWYSNWKDKDGNQISDLTKDTQLKDESKTELKPNEAIPIDNISNLVGEGDTFDERFEGYTFKGWARVPNNIDTTADSFNANTYMYLYWDGEAFHVDSKDGTIVTEVAADENTPYHDMYAVWEINKYTVTVTKTVESVKEADQHIGFTFAPEFTKYSGGSNFILSGEETTVTDSGTTITYYTSKTFENVPYGATLELTETERSDFITTVKATQTTNADGSAIVNPQAVDKENGATYTIEGDLTIAYTNTKNTRDIKVFKKDAQADPTVALGGAQFTIDDNTLITGEDGYSGIVTLGVSNDTYNLVETVAPIGYNLPDNTIEIRVTSEKVQYKQSDNDGGQWKAAELVEGGIYVVEVTNTAGEPLPMTGGIGTTIFYILGSMLVVGCGVVLVARRRMRIHK